MSLPVLLLTGSVAVVDIVTAALALGGGNLPTGRTRPGVFRDLFNTTHSKARFLPLKWARRTVIITILMVNTMTGSSSQHQK